MQTFFIFNSNFSFAVRWGNFSLNVDPDTTGTAIDEQNRNGTLVLGYKTLTGTGADGPNSVLNSATIKCVFFAETRNTDLETELEFWFLIVLQIEIFYQTRLLVH